jgi:hypothetical protein
MVSILGTRLLTAEVIFSVAGADAKTEELSGCPVFKRAR